VTEAGTVFFLGARRRSVYPARNALRFWYQEKNAANPSIGASRIRRA